MRVRKKKITAIMQLEGNGLSWEYARRPCATCIDELARIQRSSPSSPFCQTLLTLSCSLLSTDIFQAEENHVKFMYKEGNCLSVLLDLSFKGLDSFD